MFEWAIENIVIANKGSEKHARAHIYPIYETLLLSAELIGRMAIHSLEQLKRIRSYAATVNSNTSILVYPDSYGGRTERDRALQYLKEWFKEEVKDYLIICDQYFGIDDLGVLFLLNSQKPNCRVSILTSMKHLEKTAKPWQDTFSAHWYNHITPIQAPPDTDIIVIGKRDGKSPIHDRWWLTNGSGLYLGTSYGGLAKSLSNIKVINASEAELREKEIYPYLMRYKKEYQGESLNYAPFRL